MWLFNKCFHGWEWSLLMTQILLLFWSLSWCSRPLWWLHDHKRRSHRATHSLDPKREPKLWIRENHALPWASQLALVVKNPPANSGDVKDVAWIPGSRRSPGGGHGNPLQHSCLENPMDRGAWHTTVNRVTKSQMWLMLLSTHAWSKVFFVKVYNTGYLKWTENWAILKHSCRGYSSTSDICDHIWEQITLPPSLPTSWKHRRRITVSTK